jgi:hypothetical protein
MKLSWYEEVFEHIDNKRVEEFLSFISDDIKLTFANQPCAEGKEAVRSALTVFWQMIYGLKHQFTHVFESEGHVIFEGTVKYTRLDQTAVSVPCVTIIKVSDELAKEWRIYTDLTPVFSAH